MLIWQLILLIVFIISGLLLYPVWCFGVNDGSDIGTAMILIITIIFTVCLAGLLSWFIKSTDWSFLSDIIDFLNNEVFG